MTSSCLALLFVGNLLDISLKSSNAKQNFQHGPIKIAELGVEVSHLGSLAMIRGFKFEGFLLETKLTNKFKALAEKIRDNLLQSKFHFFFFNMSCQQSDLFFFFPTCLALFGVCCMHSKNWTLNALQKSSAI